MRTMLSALLVCLCTTCLLSSAATGLPSPTLPDGLGVNIHFTDPRPGEMKMLADGGFTWIRMDFAWAGTEREKGKYDFSAYERLLKTLDGYKIRAVLILDYTNDLYDKVSPHTGETREAMAHWAAAAVTHFKGRGVIWEMWNEPNIENFWKPKADVDDYAKLALVVGKAIHDAEPAEVHVGPATSTIDLKFLEACFKAGCLEYWSAVSVHPYRQDAPETVMADYAKVRQLIEQYGPKGKVIPILSGEWGYSSAWDHFDEQQQGKYLPRQWLTNVLSGVPLSIWYDWHDDGPDPKEGEHHFGTVSLKYFEGRDPVYDAKPAYVAAQTLAAQLRGYRFSKRLDTGSDKDFVLTFSPEDHNRGTAAMYAVWTTDKEPHDVPLFAKGRYAATDSTGHTKTLDVTENVRILATDAPQYVKELASPERENKSK